MKEIIKILDVNGIKEDEYQLQKNKILLKVGITGKLLYDLSKEVSEMKIVGVYINSTYYRKGFRLMILFTEKKLIIEIH